MEEKESEWSYWLLIIILIADLIIGLQLLINPELITDLQFTYIGIVFICMAIKIFLAIVLKFTNNKIEKDGRK